MFLVLFTIFHFDLEKFISKNCKYIFFYQKFVYLGKNTSKNCSRIIVVHVHPTELHPACATSWSLLVFIVSNLSSKQPVVRCVNYYQEIEISYQVVCIPVYKIKCF